jgi:hypothetical protein
MSLVKSVWRNRRRVEVWFPDQYRIRLSNQRFYASSEVNGNALFADLPCLAPLKAGPMVQVIASAVTRPAVWHNGGGS